MAASPPSLSSVGMVMHYRPGVGGWAKAKLLAAFDLLTERYLLCFYELLSSEPPHSSYYYYSFWLTY